MIFYTQTQLWLLAALILVLFELSAPGLFYSFSLAAGAVVASVAAYLDYSLATQLATLLAGSALSLVILRALVRKVNTPHLNNETNVFALIGKKGIVVRGTGELGAQVRVGGEIWSAKTFDNQPLKVKTKVKIKNVTGTKLVVEIDKELNGKGLE